MKTVLFAVFAFWWQLPHVAVCQEHGSVSVPDSELVLVVEIRNRLYPDWSEEQRLHLQEHFYLGDSEFTARIQRLVPDFRIGDGGAILNFSEQLKNPAAQVVVYHDTTAVDTSWAFLNFPPHFSPRAFFTFQLKEIIGYKPGTIPVSAGPEGKAPATSAGDSVAVRRKEEGDD